MNVQITIDEETLKKGLTMARQKSPQKIIDDWNAKYPAGTIVDLIRDNGKTKRTITRSKAHLLSGHTAVIWLEGVTGCYALERVKAVNTEIREGKIRKGGLNKKPTSPPPPPPKGQGSLIKIQHLKGLLGGSHESQ